MNRGIAPIFIILIIAVVVVGGGFLVLQNREETPTDESVTAPSERRDEAMAGTEATTKGNFFDMLATGGPRECTWTIPPIDGQEFEPGTVWFDGKGSARSSFSSKDPSGDEEVTVQGIMTGGKLYSWVQLPGAGTFGVQMDQEKVENFEQLPPEQREQARTYQQEVKFDCKPWVVDRSFFEPPSDITFQAF